MHARLSADLIHQIQTSDEKVVDCARRLGVSVAAVSKYRPRFRGHLSDIELDSIVAEWLSGVPDGVTAARLGVRRSTVYKARRRAYAALLKGNNDGE